MEDEELLDELGSRLAARKGKAPGRLSEKLVATELGFSTEVQQREERLRGHFDASRVKRDHPQLVKLVEWLLGLKFIPWDVIANEAGMTWQTVSAIAADRKESVKEFKARNAHSLKLIIEAGLPGMMQKAKDGKLEAYDLKLLGDLYLLMAGEATAITENKGLQVSPEDEELLRMLSARPVSALPPSPMVLEVGEISAMEAGAVGPLRLAEGVSVAPVDTSSGRTQSQHAHNEHETD
jgi:hypothetical protein